MGGVAGATGAGRRPLTRWAFALDEVARGDGGRVALILAPGQVDNLPPLRGDALAASVAGGARQVRRRQLLTALARRLGVALTGNALTVGPDGIRRLGTSALYASVTECTGWVAAIVAPTPVGIDLERVDEAAAGAAAVIDGIDVVNTAAWHGLAGVWAAREATLKAMGRDLTTDPKGWLFGAGIVTAGRCRPHHVDLMVLPGRIAAAAYPGN